MASVAHIDMQLLCKAEALPHITMRTTKKRGLLCVTPAQSSMENDITLLRLPSGSSELFQLHDSCLIPDGSEQVPAKGTENPQVFKPQQGREFGGWGTCVRRPMLPCVCKAYASVLCMHCQQNLGAQVPATAIEHPQILESQRRRKVNL